jgi:membrane-associated phospholipid phosphatase
VKRTGVWVHSMRPSDILTVGFCLCLAMLTAAFHRAIPSAFVLVLIYLSLAAVQWALPSLRKLSPFLALSHDLVFPVVAVLVIFDSLGLVVHSVNPRDIDHILIRLDYLLFGVYPTVYLERFVNPYLTDVLQAAYSSYYFLPVTLGVYVRLKRDDTAFSETIFAILLCFYLSYVGYILFPALGPRYVISHLHESEVGGFLLAETIQRVLNMLEGIKRDAFPSGHTAIALTVLFIASRHARALFRLFTPFVVLLVVATVYCRYHYVVDVIAGVALAVVTIGTTRIYFKFYYASYITAGSTPVAGHVSHD